jgi:hypothetical protein
MCWIAGFIEESATATATATATVTTASGPSGAPGAAILCGPRHEPDVSFGRLIHKSCKGYCFPVF